MDVRAGAGVDMPQVERLRLIPASTLAKLYEEWRADNHQGFYPAVGGEGIPTHPFAAFMEGTQHKVPLLIGSNADECSLFYDKQAALDGPKLPAITFEQRQRDYSKGFREDQTGLLASEFGESDAAALEKLYSGLTTDKQIIEFWGDFTFGAKAHWLAHHHAPSGGSSFLYLFSRVPPSPTQTAGAFHAAELSFVFGEYRSFLGNFTTDEMRLSKEMTSRWTTFAATGDPNSNAAAVAGTEMGLPANVWPKFEGEAPQWINFNAQEVKVEPVSRLEKHEVLNRSRHRQMEALIEARQHKPAQ